MLTKMVTSRTNNGSDTVRLGDDINHCEALMYDVEESVSM